MEYKPRYSQPFTLAEAIALDVSVITDEIARLQNSLKHLRQTQKELQDYISSESTGTQDPEVSKAIEENEVVIGSQDERISILKMALTEKGVLGGSHYDIATNENTTPHPDKNPPSSQTIVSASTAEEEEEDDDDSGIHL